MKSRHSLVDTAEKVYGAALDAVDPGTLIRDSVSLQGDCFHVQDKIYNLSAISNVYLIAFGKAAPYMAVPLVDLLGRKLKEGIVLYLPGRPVNLKGVTCLPASHPLPDQKSQHAARAILDLAERAGELDLMVVCISGGGSAQISLPAAGLSLDEKRIITDRLMKAGADINELNTVRKHLSRIKGGRLARAAWPARMITLILSDVLGNDMETIASGPFYWDSSTFKDAEEILLKYGLLDSAPPAVKKVLEEGMAGYAEETLKSGDPVFRRVSNRIIGDNRKALLAAERKAAQLGFQTQILTSEDQGEAREYAHETVEMLRKKLDRKHRNSAGLCFLSGGELTVTVKGKGKGGRNQEFALAALCEVRKQPLPADDWAILSLGTDGVDGPSDAAGACVSPAVIERSRKLSLDPDAFLAENDAYHFFERTGGLIKTGPTNTNVMDIRIFLFK